MAAPPPSAPCGSHISLSNRKLLCARYLWLEAVQEVGLFLRASKRTAALAILDQYVEQFHKTAQEVLEDGKSLGNYLQALLKVLGDVAIVGKEKDVGNALVTRLESKINDLKCQYCTLCVGTDEDDAHVVSDSTDCLGYVTGAFGAASEIAKRYYRTFATSYDPNKTPSTVLSTGFVRESKVNRTGLPIAGETHFHDTVAVKGCDVKATVSLRVDWCGFVAIPYLLLHEILCHVYFQSAIGNKLRVDPEPEDSFGEGWMDWVALRILEETMAGRGPAHDVRASFRAPYHVADGAKEMHRQRMALSEEDCTDQWVLGSAAAKRALDWFTACSETGWELFLRFSLEANLNGLWCDDWVARNHIVTAIYGALVPGAQLGPKQKQIQKLFSEFDGDAAGLVAFLRTLI